VEDGIEKEVTPPERDELFVLKEKIRGNYKNK
jgi:hypothetical protein